MARSTLEAVFGALGAGLQGYGMERRQRELDEERRRREAIGDSLKAAEMLASGRYGTEAQLRTSGGEAFRTAGQMAAGALAPTRGRVPSADELSNLGTASRRGAAPPMFEVGGQQLGVMRTAADEERLAENRQMQSQAMLALQQAERDKALGAQRMREIRAQTASAERIAGMRTDAAAGGGAGARTSRGSIQRDVLPTVSRTAQEFPKFTEQEILAMSPSAVWAATTAPLMMAEPSPASVIGAAGMNLLSGNMGSGKEQQYAQMLAATADAAARIGEAVGVLTNQDIARYRAQVTPLPGDRDDVRLRKHENAVSWANYLSRLGQVAASGRQLTPDEIQQLKDEAQSIGGNTDERATFDTWERENPQRPNEDDRSYVARFRTSIGMRR